MGSIFGRNQKAYDRWRKKGHRASGTHQRGLVGQALESAVMGIAAMFPDNVTRVTV